MITPQDLNKQSAELLLQDIENKLQEQKDALAAAQKQKDEMDYEVLYKDAKLQIDSLSSALVEKDKMLTEYQTLNQKLFLKVGQPLDASMQPNPTLEAQPSQDELLIKSAMEKINAYNQQVDEQNKLLNKEK